MTIADRPHVCTSCGRACGACAEAAQHGQPLPHTVRLPWCAWCTAIYADNAPDPDTGRVHCGRCDRPLPTLAKFVEEFKAQRLRQFPLYCRECRADIEQQAKRIEKRGDRSSYRPHEPAPAPLAAEPEPPPSRKTPDPADLHWMRGGFRPRRPGPETDESELGDGRTAWPGVRVAR